MSIWDLIGGYDNDPQSQEKQMYAQLRNYTDKHLRELAGSGEYYVVSKSWVRLWKQYTHFNDDEDMNVPYQKYKPPMMNKELLTNEKFLFNYIPLNNTLNFGIKEFRHPSEYELVQYPNRQQFNKELYSFMATKYETLVEPITRIAVYNPQLQSQQINANLAKYNLIYVNPKDNKLHCGLMQVDLHCTIGNWKQLLKDSLDQNLGIKTTDIRLWKNKFPKLSSERVLKQLSKTPKEYDGDIINENHYLVCNLQFQNNECIVIDLQIQQQWQFSQANHKNIIKEIYPTLVQRLLNGCGREICDFEYCHCNPYFNQNSYTREEAATISLHLINDNEQIVSEICDSPSKIQQTLQLSEIMKIKDSSQLIDRINMLTQNTDVFGASLAIQKQKQPNKEVIRINEDDADIDIDSIELIMGLISQNKPKLQQKNDSEYGAQLLSGWIMNLFGQKDPANVIKNTYHLRALFIVLLFRQFYETVLHYRNNYVLNVIGSLTQSNKDILAKWLSILTAAQFSDYLNQLKQYVAVQVAEMQSKAIPFIDIEDTYRMRCVMDLITLFYRSNQISVRVTYKEFFIEPIQQFYKKDGDVLEYLQYRAYRRQRWDSYYFSFCQYPFVVPTELKNKILNIESRVQQKEKIRDAINSYSFLMGQMPYLKLEVTREDIIGTVLKQLSQSEVSLKMPLRVTFVGEQGVDEGGVRREFFSLLMQNLFNLDYGMFVLKMHDRGLWFNPHSLEMPIQYELIGIVLGLALYNQVLLDLKFPSVIYKKLQDEQTGVDDLKELDIDLYTGLMQLRQYDKPDIETSFCLTFQISYNVWGENFLVDLKPNGNNIPVSQANKEEYIKLYTDWYLNKSIERQFYLFKQGFEKVVTGDVIKLFVGEELQTLIVGSPHFDMKELEKVAQLDGFAKGSEYIKMFWETIHSFDQTQQKRFLFFCTGSDRVPVGGLGSMKFVIQKHGENTEQLPSAHTCFNVLLLPKYKSREILKKKLIIALNNAEGFGLM